MVKIQKNQIKKIQKINLKNKIIKIKKKQLEILFQIMKLMQQQIY
jgi:hypothetical protein